MQHQFNRKGTEVRQEHLIKGKYFACDCRRCLDPTEMGTRNITNKSLIYPTSFQRINFTFPLSLAGTHLSSIRCQSCTLSFMIRLNGDNTWTCLNCNATKRNEEIQLILCECRRQVQQIGPNIEHIEAFIEKYTHLLHPNHYLLIEMKQKLAAIIRHMIATIHDDKKNASDQRASMECLFKRKIQLCKEFVPLLDILQPGISRLKAIVLYEQFGPIVQLTKLYHQQKIICDTECMVNIDFTIINFNHLILTIKF